MNDNEDHKIPCSVYEKKVYRNAYDLKIAFNLISNHAWWNKNKMKI